MSKPGFYEKIYKIFAGLVRKLYRIEIRGAENEPQEGSCVVCCNHLANSDVVILAASLKRQVHFFAKAELFRIPLLKQLITALGAFPVKRGEGDVSAIKKTISILQDGKMVGFYPQGTRCPGVHPRETKTKNGIGMIAYRTHATILPVAITVKNFRVHMFRKTLVTIGKPILYEDLHMESPTPDEYKKAAEYVFSRIVEMA